MENKFYFFHKLGNSRNVLAYFMALVNISAMGSPFIKMKGDAIMENNYRAAFALKHLAKDLRLAKSEGLATPLGEVAFRTFQQAEPAFGEDDIIAVIRQLNPAQ